MGEQPSGSLEEEHYGQPELGRGPCGQEPASKLKECKIILPRNTRAHTNELQISKIKTKEVETKEL